MKAYLEVVALDTKDVVTTSCTADCDTHCWDETGDY